MSVGMWKIHFKQKILENFLALTADFTDKFC